MRGQLIALFFIRLFSSIAFAVFFSSLRIYLLNNTNIDPHTANAIVGTFIALNYSLAIVGGHIGGRLISYRFMLIMSILMQTIGSGFVLTYHLSSINWFVAIFLAGSLGLNVSINMIITKAYSAADTGRETAFFWSYMAMNLGYFCGYTISGYLCQSGQYHNLLLAITIAGITSIILTLCMPNSDKDCILNNKASKLILAMTAVVITVFITRYMLAEARFVNTLIIIGWAACLLSTLTRIKKLQSSQERQKMLIFISLMLSAVVFWSIYLLAPIALIIFIKQNVNLILYSIHIPAQWTQNVNTIVIVIGASAVALLAKPSASIKKKKNLQLPLHFGISIVLLGLGFIALGVGILAASGNGMVALHWVVISYILQSVGELFIGPIGFATVGRLVPPAMQGAMTGLWIMLLGVSAAIASKISNLIDIPSKASPITTNPQYLALFLALGAIAIVAGIIIAGLNKRIMSIA